MENSLVLKKLGAEIKAQRKSLGLNQTDLSQMADVGINLIGQIESGKPSVHFSKLLDVLKSLGMEFRLDYGKNGISFK